MNMMCHIMVATFGVWGVSPIAIDCNGGGGHDKARPSLVQSLHRMHDQAAVIQPQITGAQATVVSCICSEYTRCIVNHKVLGDSHKVHCNILLLSILHKLQCSACSRQCNIAAAGPGHAAYYTQLHPGHNESAGCWVELAGCWGSLQLHGYAPTIASASAIAATHTFFFIHW